MANASPVPPTLPPAHEGVHHDNPSSKPLRAPVPPDERDGVQRLVWRLFFFLVLAVALAAVLLSIFDGRP
jgi:hypothetical protein